jgi:membrane glycosyltransferase
MLSGTARRWCHTELVNQPLLANASKHYFHTEHCCCCIGHSSELTIQLLVVAGPVQLHAANPALAPDATTTVRLDTNGAWPRAGVACDVLPPGVALHAAESATCRC